MDEEPKGQKIPTKIRPYLFLDPLFCSSDFWLSKDLLCTNSERLSILYTEQTLKLISVPCKLYPSIDSCGGSYSVGTVNFTIIEKWGVDATDHVLDMTGHAFVCWSS